MLITLFLKKLAAVVPTTHSSGITSMIRRDIGNLRSTARSSVPRPLSGQATAGKDMANQSAAHLQTSAPPPAPPARPVLIGPGMGGQVSFGPANRGLLR